MEHEAAAPMDEEELPPMQPDAFFALTESNQLVHDVHVTNIQNVKVLTREKAHALSGATAEHVQHNKDMLNGKSEGYTVLGQCNAWDSKIMCFVNSIDPPVAAEAARWLEAHTCISTSDDGAKRMSVKVGNITHVGYRTYPATYAPFHDADKQESCTVLMKKGVLSDARLLQINTLNEAVQKDIMDGWESTHTCEKWSLRLIQLHVLRQGDLLACPSCHIDKVGDTKKADITAIVNLANAPSSMFVVGAKEDFFYDGMGACVSFPSDFYHFTSSACAGSVKIAFFYEIVRTPVVQLEGEGDDDTKGAAGSSSDAPPPSKKAKVDVPEASEVKSEPDATSE